MVQCSHGDQGLDRGQPFCQPLPAIAGVMAGEQFRAGRNKHAAGVIHSDLPHHHVKLRGQAPLQAPPVLTTIVTAVQGSIRALAPARRPAATPPAAPYNGVPGRS